ncbi:MAG: DJ-1/PfpI family protein [Lachnospiraceae bacterium]|nr:DJ-1/PfpI family protein [Lachnospiraceae bacterium]
MNVNILLFPDFETLDAFGPVEVLGRIEQYRLHYVSITGGTIVSRQGVPVLTENINDVDATGILLIPGGQGTRPLVNEDEYINKLANAALLSEYCLTVCTGSALLAKTGVLDYKKATSNKKAFEWVKSINTKVLWINHARWVVDEKYYTSSGVSAGIDMALGFVADQFGNEKAEEIANHIEYLWNPDPCNDKFAI